MKRFHITRKKTIIIAGIAGVNPMEIAKRNFLPMVGAMVLGMAFLM